MSFRITIEWSQTGEESRTHQLVQLDLEEEIADQDPASDARLAHFTVQASDHRDGDDIPIASFRVGPLDRENFLETAVECLTVLRDTKNPVGSTVKTVLPEASTGEKFRSKKPFGQLRYELGEDPEPVVLLAEGIPERDQSPVRLPLPHSFKKASAREPHTDIAAVLEVEKPTLPAVDDLWGDVAKSARPVAWGWFALLGLLFGGACLWSLLQVIRSDDGARQIEVSSKTLLDTEEQADREASQLIDRINATILNYFSRTNVDELIPLVRHSERVAPLMREYYKDKPVFLGTVSSIEMLVPFTIDKRTDFWGASVALSKGPRFTVAVEVTRSGEILVDWKSLVCHQPMNWTDYAQKRPEGTTMDFRVYGEPTDFNTHEFQNSKEWLCLRLTAPGSEEFLFGYAKIDSEEGSLLRRLLKKNNLQKATLTLRLTVPEGVQSPRGVVIEQVLNPGWIDLDPYETEPITDTPPTPTPEPKPDPAAPPSSGP